MHGIIPLKLAVYLRKQPKDLVQLLLHCQGFAKFGRNREKDTEDVFSEEMLNCEIESVSWSEGHESTGPIGFKVKSLFHLSTGV